LVEWVIIIAILIVIPVSWTFMKITWNIAKGGVDLMEFFGNAGRAGTRRQMSNDEINERKKQKYKPKKWDIDGKRS